MENKAFESDGGSSKIYTLELYGYVEGERDKKVKVTVETEDIIKYVFNNDFDAGNVFKSLVRLWSSKMGFGKKGNSIEYEGNKIKYSLNKLTKREI